MSFHFWGMNLNLGSFQNKNGSSFSDTFVLKKGHEFGIVQIFRKMNWNLFSRKNNITRQDF